MSKRNTKEYYEWRVQVFERDNYTCVMCGTTEGRLCTHHIIPMDYNKPWTQDSDLDVTNGICVCIGCHNIIHHKGRKNSEETRKKISVANKGRKNSEETRKKISVANKGRKLSEETRRNMSESKMGEKNPMYQRNFSIEHRRKISEGGKGKIYTDEAKKKISIRQTGENNSMYGEKGKKFAELGWCLRRFRKLRDTGEFGDVTTIGGIYV